MHLTLTELLETEVMGELVLVEGAFRDDSRGRICLDRLDEAEVTRLVERLRQRFEGTLNVNDRLYRIDDKQAIRGVMELELVHDEQAPYLLEISHPAVFALYEQRFMLDPETPADLRGVLCDALHQLVLAGGAYPLRVISGFDELFASYAKQLDAVLKGAYQGHSVDSSGWVDQAAAALRRMWQLIPWQQRQLLVPLYGRPRDDSVSTEPTMQGTLYLASNGMRGTLPSTYLHESHPEEDAETTHQTLAEIFASVVGVFHPPVYTVAMGRARSIESYRRAFPRFEKVVGGIVAEETQYLG